MRDFCPLCKMKITTFQINFEEAVWMCKNNKCCWPFGYEDPVIFPRSAHAYFTDKNKNQSQSKEPMSTELSLYTPPVTPGRESIDLSAIGTLEERSSEISVTSDATALKRELSDSGNLMSFKPLNIQSHGFIEDNIITAKDNLTRDTVANVNKALPKITDIQQSNIDLCTAFQNLGKGQETEGMTKETSEQSHLLACISPMEENTGDLNCTTNKICEELADDWLDMLLY